MIQPSTNELPITVSLPTVRTKHGRMRVASLRPGDFLVAEHPYGNVYILVKINSAKLQRIVLVFPDGKGVESVCYATLARLDYLFAGHGHRRAWYKLLPKWIAKHVCEFGRPT